MKQIFPDIKLLLFLIFISLLLILLDSLNFLTLPQKAIQTVTAPIQYGLYKGGKTLGAQFEFLILARKAAQENKALKIQLGELLTETANLKSQLSETQELIDQYNKLSPKTFDLLPARIIGTGRYLIIDKGLTDKIDVGQTVVFKDNYIGQIKSSDPKISTVLLLTDPDSRVAVFSQGEEGRARGILSGQFGSDVLMDKILHQEEVKIGDLVYSEGTEGRLPKGLIMGRVIQVFERENEIFKQAKVEPVFNVEDLDVVFVIRI